VAEILKFGVGILSGFSESANADAALLMAQVLGKSRAWIVAHSDAVPSEQQSALFIEFCNRRRTGEPIAYILGSAGFYGREFVVDDRVLVPRPETEHLVEEAIRFIRGPMRVLDVGTGSGAIACTVAAETPATVDATDTSPGAIELAAANAQRLGLADRCSFYRGDLTAPVRHRRYDVVIANLPYIATSDLPKPPDSASFEPREALDGGDDGLTHYRRLLPQVAPLLKDEALIVLEAAPPTISKLFELTRSTFPSFAVERRRDYSGLDRYVRAVTLK
jgi:release factor glutamine methyltransferase